MEKSLFEQYMEKAQSVVLDEGKRRKKKEVEEETPEEESMETPEEESIEDEAEEVHTKKKSKKK